MYAWAFTWKAKQNPKSVYQVATVRNISWLTFCRPSAHTRKKRQVEELNRMERIAANPQCAKPARPSAPQCPLRAENPNRVSCYFVPLKTSLPSSSPCALVGAGKATTSFSTFYPQQKVSYTSAYQCYHRIRAPGIEKTKKTHCPQNVRWEHPLQIAPDITIKGTVLVLCSVCFLILFNMDCLWR